MPTNVEALLQRLHTEGVEHDNATEDRVNKRLNITPSTGECLHWLVNELRPKRILELGTSNGYSTIWLGRAAEMVQADVVSVEFLAEKVGQAAQNIKSAELQENVRLQLQSIGRYLQAAPDIEFDFVFLDSDRNSYTSWWPDLCRVIKFGTLVVDNAISHAEQMKPFHDLLIETGEFELTTHAIGKGQLVVRQKDDPLDESLVSELQERSEHNHE